MASDAKTTDHVETLLVKATQAKTPLEAMQFAQAACNAANAICALADSKKK